MATAQSVHTNFRDAYCYYHGCSPAGFDRHLLLRIVPLLFRPLAALSFWINREIFASELEVIRNAAPARTGREVNSAAQDLVHLRFVEHSFRRSMGMRGRSEAVVEAWNQVKATVDRPTIPDHPSIGFAEGASHLSAASRSSALGRNDSALTIRALRRVHQEVSSGKPISQILAAEGLTHDQLIGLLNRNLQAFDGFAGLRDQLLEQQGPNSPTPPSGEVAQSIPQKRPSRSIS